MFLNILFTLVGFLYYLPFVNRGIVLSDEGYYVHNVDRILRGEIPYKDFFLQFPPLYFYTLSGIFKIFGEKIIVERIFTLILCSGVIFLNLRITEKLGIKNFKLKFLVFLSLVSFGFPLINNPSTLAWASILSVSILIYTVINWLIKKKNLFLIGISLAILFSLKQNLGIYFFILTNLFILFNSKKRLKDLLELNIPFLLLTSIWIYYFFHQNWNLFIEFISFNQRYASIYPLSYPPFSYLFQPIGIFKLIPYYLPIIYLLIFFKKFKKINSSIRFFTLSSLIGFFGTVIPTSDLLHVYPFYPMVLISGILILRKNKLVILFTIISIISGLYLTLFREYYRYQPIYSQQNTSLKLARSQGILVDKPLAEQISGTEEFIKKNPGENKFALVYPFSPMIYFLFELNNPSRYSIYYPGYLTSAQEGTVLKDIETKRVKYIITVSKYKFNTPISKFILRQKEVYNNGIFKVFEII